MFVLCYIRTVAWNVKLHEGRTDLKTVQKNGSKGKNPGQAKKYNPAGGMDVCVVFVVLGLVWIISDMKKDGRI
jgi:hypothetical protein